MWVLCSFSLSLVTDHQPGKPTTTSVSVDEHDTDPLEESSVALKGEISVNQYLIYQDGKLDRC